MAPPAGTLRVGRYFLALLAILAVLYVIVFWPGQRHTPKLGLDLQGGTQVIFTAKTPGGGTPSKSSMNEAKSIMEQRVNGSGVTEADVVIEGDNRIVISIPGNTDTDISKLGRAAALSMRGMVMPIVPIACESQATAPASPTAAASPSASPAPSATGSASPNSRSERLLTAPTPTTTPTGTASPTGTTSPRATPTGSGTAPAKLPPCTGQPFKGLPFEVPSSDTEFQQLNATQQEQLKAALGKADCAQAADQPDDAPYYYACYTGDNFGAPVAFLLGDVIVKGTEISGASAAAPNSAAGKFEWTVQLKMKSGAQKKWAKYTAAHNVSGLGGVQPDITSCGPSAVPCADFVGFVLDGQILSYPYNSTAINSENTEISGSFTQKSAKELANQLKYGALPLSFTADAAQTVSATLGTSQMEAGLLAGGIGLILVVIYSLIYYRALGLVTIMSLVVSAVLTYACLVILAEQIGFTLSLAGIAGFIVAVGITADSFIVFFERIKDEVHDGRSMRVAVPRAWVRARRTILSADTVSFLAAAVLYYFAAGDVKGFAFTLGLSTVLDLVVVFLFTHPMVSLLSRSKAFGSARFTGLNAAREGGIVPDTESRAGASPVAPVKPPKVGRGSKPAKPQAAKTAVLERKEPRDAEFAEPAETEQATSIEELEVDEPAEPPAAERAETEMGETEVGERRHTTPEPGSAAERAAARRARLRAEGDEKGKR